MDFKQIEYLLEKYYEGETTVDEEETLKQFFVSADVPARLKAEQAQFLFLAQAAKENTVRSYDEVTTSRKAPAAKRIVLNPFFKTIAAAACFAALLCAGGGFYLMEHAGTSATLSKNSTDYRTLLAYAQTRQALLKISTKLNMGNDQVERLVKLSEAEHLITEKN